MAIFTSVKATENSIKMINDFFMLYRNYYCKINAFIYKSKY
jgi:hypothetical protein